MEKGVQTPEQIIAGIPNGFYVTELMGSGRQHRDRRLLRGAAGLWIRNGELAFAVSEVTIAGNLKDIGCWAWRRWAPTWSSEGR